jgi:RNase P subunit RPR2
MRVEGAPSVGVVCTDCGEVTRVRVEALVRAVACQGCGAERRFSMPVVAAPASPVLAETYGPSAPFSESYRRAPPSPLHA